MAKILNLQNNISELQFETPQSKYRQFREKYKTTELGKLSAVIPWTELVREMQSKMPSKSRGPQPVFSLRGQIGLMILKSLWGLSDRQLMERLGTDWSAQFFCDVYIDSETKLPDYKIISDIRCTLAKYIDIDDMQACFAHHWEPYMKDKTISLIDATCFETDMRYPTDEKLLWEGCVWIHKWLKRMCKSVRVKMPRSKYREQRKKQLAFRKRKRKTYKDKRRRRKSLLYLLTKLLGQVMEIEIIHNPDLKSRVSRRKRFHTIVTMREQQQYMYDEKVNKVSDRIVSIDKPYIRPIVRGKERKRVEWGAKVNMFQADGMNFIECLNFNAFHEGNRLGRVIAKHRTLFGKVTQLTGDQIYAANANRTMCREEDIFAGFKPKGRRGKNEEQRKQLARALNLERSTRLEGSFGCAKEHYHLKRIKARTKPTEILWIFFGVMTANARLISERTAERKKKKQTA